MRKSSALMLLLLIISASVQAQTDTARALVTVPTSLPKPGSTVGTPRDRHSVAFGIHVPVGSFAESHIAGAGLSYILFSRHYTRIGKYKYIAPVASAGVDYFLGKKTEVAGHDFKYGGYTYLHIQGGVHIGPLFKTGISLTGGPSAGIYKGNTDFGWIASLFLNCKLYKRVVLGLGATVREHAQTDALWTVAARALYQL
jgi:hypothetical protein